MEKVRNNCGTKAIKAGLIQLSLFIFINSAVAATIDWKGTTNSDWGTGTNWSGGSAPSSGDAVRIGVVSFTSQPTLNSGATTTIASLTFGVSATSITLTINSGYTLAVTGAIIQNASSSILSSNTLITTITGGGSLSCASLQVGDSIHLLALLGFNNLQLTSTISSFHITGNVTVNSSNDVIIVGVGSNNAAFSLQGGTTTIDGSILTVNTVVNLLALVYTPATPKFSVDMPTGSALSPVLNLTNAAAIDPSSLTGSIDFYNNTGGTGTSTVNYNGSTQTVYTTTTTILDATPQTYQYLSIAGTGTETVGASSGGALTVGADLVTSANSTLLNVNNPTVTVSNNWTNSGNVTQGSGNITVANGLQNNANTITCGSGNLTVTAGIQINAGALTAAGGTVTDNGYFQNNGGALNCGSGNIIFKGLYQNNSGTFTASTGTVFFSGSTAQALTDLSSTGTTFNNVTFNGSNTATMNAGNANFAVSPIGVLTMVNPAQLVAGSASVPYLTLKSDTTGSATVAAIPSGCAITGFVKIQRFVQGSATYDVVKQRWKGRNYRLMSSPVNEGADASSNRPVSLNYLGASTIITDCTSSFGTTGGNPSLYLYNELYTPSGLTFISGNFIGITNINNTSASGNISTTDATNSTGNVYVGAGYMMFFRGDKVTHISGTPSKTSYPYVAPESVTFSTSGNLNQGSYSVRSWTGTAGLMYTTSNAGNLNVRGYNLVGNPYASSIDWSTFSNTTSTAPIYGVNINPTIYILNPTTNNYDTYIAGGAATGSASKIIPSGQGFFVRANNPSPTLTFNETAKTNTEVTGSNLLMGTSPAPLAVQQLLRLKLVTDSINYDDIVISFNSSASSKYNSSEDAEYLAGANALQGLSSISNDGIKLSINSLPLPKQTQQVIKLDASVKTSGIYTLQRTAIDALPAIYQVWLMDNYKKDSLDIRNNSTYAFNVNFSDTSTYGSDRFSIIIRQNPALGVHLLNFQATKVSDGAQITWKTENEENYTNFTVERSTDNGATFNVLGGFTSSALGTYSLLDSKQIIGANQYRLKIEDLNGTISYSKVVTLLNQSTDNLATVSNISIYPNPATSVINLSVNQNSIQGSNLFLTQTVAPNPGLIKPATSTSYSIKIINTTGLVVTSTTSSTTDWHGDVNQLSPGTYIIQVVNKSNNAVVGKGLFTKI